TRSKRDWSSDVCSSDLPLSAVLVRGGGLGVLVVHGAAVGGNEQLVAGGDPDGDAPLAEYVHHTVAHGQGGIEGVRIADGEDHVGRGIAPAVHRHHRAGAAHLAGGQDPLPVEGDGLRPGGAQLIDHREDVVVVDEVVGLVP